MGYNKDVNITPLPLLLYSNNYTTSQARAHCTTTLTHKSLSIVFTR